MKTIGKTFYFKLSLTLEKSASQNYLCAHGIKQYVSFRDVGIRDMLFHGTKYFHTEHKKEKGKFSLIKCVI